MRDETASAFILTLLFAAMFILAFFHLGSKNFWASKAESRRAEIGWNMVSSGDYLIPKLNGEKIFTKPPLFYWMVAGAFAATGNKSEGVARIPSALFGLGALLLVFLIASRLYGQTEALFSTAVLGTSHLFVHYMRIVELDMAFTCLTTLSFYALLRLSEDDESARLWAVLFWAAAALAFMVKGPFALLFPIGSYLAFVLITREDKITPLKTLFKSWGVLAFALLVLPWYLYVIIYDDAWAVFTGETLDRISDNKGRDFPLYYYLQSLVNFSPWIIVLPFALLWTAIKDRAQSRFVLAWLLAGLVIASAITAKNYHYILPLYPAMAILVGRFLSVNMKKAFGEWMGWLNYFATAIAFFFLIISLGVFIALPIAPHYTTQVPKIDSALTTAMIVVATILLISGFVGAIKGKPSVLWITAMGAIYFIFLFGHAIVTPQLNSRHSHKEFLTLAADEIDSAETVFQYKMNNGQVSYYLGRPAIVIRHPDKLKSVVAEALEKTERIFVVVEKRYGDETIGLVGGEVTINDEMYTPPRTKDEDKRFVLIEKKRES